MIYRSGTGCFWVSAIVLIATLAPAAERGDEEPVRFLRLGAPLGLRQYYPNTWGVVGVDLVNSGERPAEVLAAFGFDRNPHLQYARAISVPAGSVRRTWAAVRVPPLRETGYKVDCYAMLIDRSGDQEVVLRPDGERVQHDASLPLQAGSPVTGMILPALAGGEVEGLDLAYEALVALRCQQGLDRRLALISDRRLPTLTEAWEGLDQLVLHNDRFAEDPAVMAALRAWLSDGGRLWIMLDRVGWESVERLLGEAFACHVVDRVELTRVEIKTVSPRQAGGYTGVRDFEDPVPLVRVNPLGLEVSHTVDAWPAAFRCEVGRGQVILTTLGMAAWLQPRRLPQWHYALDQFTEFEPISQLEELDVLRPRQASPLAAVDWQPYLVEQVGYRIVGRSYVVAVLASFCVVLVAAGLWLSHAGQLGRMGWVAPGAALAAAAPLVWLGWESKRVVPPTLGQAQAIEVSHIPDRATASGLLALFHPSTDVASLGSDGGGVFEPGGQTGAGETLRMVWTDLDSWRWENLRLPAGLRLMSFRRHLKLDEPVQAVGTFGPAGFEGRLSGLREPAADAVIAVPGQPALAAHVDSGRAVAGPGEVLAVGQYLASRVVTDEQRRRQAIYQQLLGAGRHTDQPIHQPTLFVWSRPLDMQFVFPQGVQPTGSSLWAIPLHVQPPGPDTELVVPSPFVRYRTVRGPTGSGESPLYNRRNGAWISSVADSSTWLRFQLPPAVLPLQLHRARLSVEIEAADRDLEILLHTAGRSHRLLHRSNPLGRLDVDVTDAALLATDPQGGLLLGLIVRRVQPGEAAHPATMWQIGSVQLEVAGRHTPAKPRVPE